MNFDTLPTVREYYDGAAKKYAVRLNGSVYMVKYPAKANLKNDLNTEYSNSSFSEYISCHIINALQLPGVEAQETVLGESHGKIVVGCKDFTTPNTKLVKFNMIQNADMSSEQSGRHPILEDVLQTYDVLPELQSPEYIQRFWDTFAIDSLLGNFDRHSGNWGFLNNTETGTFTNAPIYDCGSCLYPALSEKKMLDILSSDEEIEKRIFDFPSSAFISRATGEKIRYADFIKKCDNKQFRASLDRVAQAIDFNVIDSVIENTPYLSVTQMKFYHTILRERFEKLIVRNVVRLNTVSPVQDYCNYKGKIAAEIINEPEQEQ